MDKITILIQNYNDRGYQVIRTTDNKGYLIPYSCMEGFHLNEKYTDSRGRLKLGQIYPAVQKNEEVVYFDKSNTTFWTYVPATIEESATPSEYEWLLIIQRLLELNSINGLSKEDIDDLLMLCRNRKYNEFKQLLIDKLDLFSYLFEDESLYCENKSSLVFPARKIQVGETIEDLKTEQLDVLSAELIGAGNAIRVKDFHLIIGKNDNFQFTGNIDEEINKYYEGSTRKFIDMFTNRLSQLTESTAFVSTLRMNFLTINNHSLLDICVPNWQGEILTFKKKIYLRVNAVNRELQGKDLIQFISSRYDKIN